jgi:DNA-binding XRE family transcriptional regulator
MDEKQITRNIERIRLEKNLSQEKLAKLSGLTKGHISKIESETFYDAYHIPVRFGSGSSKRLFCPDTDCVALIPGKPLRPSL